MVRRVLVAGGLGVIGRAVVEHLGGEPGVEVVALSRRTPDFETRARFVAADLRDAAATRAALAGVPAPTHVVYAALHEKPELVRGWFDPDHVRTNLAMLQSLVDAVASPELRHVTILQGTKAYGVHLGLPLDVPAREDAPRVPHENFYFHQEDWLRERAASEGFGFTIFRPQIVLGVAAGSAMNVVATLGVQLALCHELELPLVHPGHPDAVVEGTDARLLARAIRWAMEAPAARGQTFNVTNGDVLRWRGLFEALAREEGLPLVDGPAFRFAEEMPRHAEAWRALARREGLREPDLEALIGLSWQYADATYGSGQLPARPPLVSTIKLRRCGFGDCIDSHVAVLELLEAMRERRYLPGRLRRPRRP